MNEQPDPAEGKPVVFAGRYIEVLAHDGWEYVRRRNCGGAVAIVAVTDQKRLLLVEQFRVPLGGRAIELPAGLAGDAAAHVDEALATAAQRELIEETGYRAAELTALAGGRSSPGLTDEAITIFLATGLQRTGDGGGDASENITVHEVALDEVDNWLAERQQRGANIDFKVYAGLYLAQAQLEALS